MLISYRFRIYPSKTIEAKLNEQLKLRRWFVCPKCGWEEDRDYNASLNILDVAASREAPCLS